ncbi:hypothetical protein BJ165DRAFT_1532211 [Panaeolus papilionaceus]|nr:hypothetical protein BJ165DRAFT_1532211 [Panaeolus papilionaceus]
MSMGNLLDNGEPSAPLLTRRKASTRSDISPTGVNPLPARSSPPTSAVSVICRLRGKAKSNKLSSEMMPKFISKALRSKGKETKMGNPEQDSTQPTSYIDEEAKKGIRNLRESDEEDEAGEEVGDEDEAKENAEDNDEQDEAEVDKLVSSATRKKWRMLNEMKRVMRRIRRRGGSTGNGPCRRER